MNLTIQIKQFGKKFRFFTVPLPSNPDLTVMRKIWEGEQALNSLSPKEFHIEVGLEK